MILKELNEELLKIEELETTTDNLSSYTFNIIFSISNKPYYTYNIKNAHTGKLETLAEKI